MRFPHPEQMKWNPKQNLPIAINTQKSSHTVQFHSVIHYFPFSTYSLDIAHNITACAWFAFQSTHTHTHTRIQSLTRSWFSQSLIHSVAFSPTHIVAPEKFRLPALRSVCFTLIKLYSYACVWVCIQIYVRGAVVGRRCCRRCSCCWCHCHYCYCFGSDCDCDCGYGWCCVLLLSSCTQCVHTVRHIAYNTHNGITGWRTKNPRLHTLRILTHIQYTIHTSNVYNSVTAFALASVKHQATGPTDACFHDLCVHLNKKIDDQITINTNRTANGISTTSAALATAKTSGPTLSQFLKRDVNSTKASFKQISSWLSVNVCEDGWQNAAIK